MMSCIRNKMNLFICLFACDQGLSGCTIKDDSPVPPLSATENDAVDVRNLMLQPWLCCRNRTRCSLCLQIHTELYVHPNNDMEHESSGLDEDDGEVARSPTGSVLPVCKRVEFTSAKYIPPIGWLVFFCLFVFVCLFVFYLQSPCITCSLCVCIYVTSTAVLVCTPQLQERIEECDIPTVHSIIDQKRNEVELQVVGKNNKLLSHVCLQYEETGKCQLWNNRTIPLYSVTSCLFSSVCIAGMFQRNVWDNVSVSVLQAHMSSNIPILSWNISAPCMLEAEVWPCHRTAGVKEKGCKEMKGFRQQLLNRAWKQNKKGHWEKTGVFEDIDLQFSPCVMVKYYYLPSRFSYPLTGRWRLSLLFVALVLLVCVTALILCLLQDVIKIGRTGHVVLLSPPDVEGGVSELVCRLGSLLHEQGFSVSVDQWCRMEQSSLGPIPWLHSQLLKLDNLRGQVVLVLTRQAWEGAEEWTQQYKEAQGKQKDNPQVLSPFSDVFMASLCTIQADKQLGRAGERFLLVNFESHPAQPPGSDQSLPELLQGLSLFHLPSQTQALLSQLKRGRAFDKKRWMRLDEQKTPPHKYFGVEKNWEMKLLKQEL
uniref:SEFIR domain-containing protein n=1 Tax=Myripristis murdjan TaxID=586833 RepID=A0A667YKS5_9TELE